MSARLLRGWLLAAWMTVMTGCATTPPVPPTGSSSSPMPQGGSRAPAGEQAQPASPVPGTPVGTTRSGGRIVTNGRDPALADTLPSAEAEEVLATIPEPLASRERVDPPAGARPSSSQGDAAPSDSLEESAASDTLDPGEEGADVPVPEPTAPLGERRRTAMPDTSQGSSPAVTPAAPAPSAQPPSSAPSKPPPRQTAKPDTCWRVQVAAVPEPERAEALRTAAQSQLLVPFVVEIEGGLRKVRSRECSGAASADMLRKRAALAGFEGAFRFRPRRK